MNNIFCIEYSIFSLHAIKSAIAKLNVSVCASSIAIFKLNLRIFERQIARLSNVLFNINKVIYDFGTNTLTKR